MPDELQTKQGPEMTFGVSNGFYQRNGRQMVKTPLVANQTRC